MFFLDTWKRFTLKFKTPCISISYTESVLHIQRNYFKSKNPNAYSIPKLATHRPSSVFFGYRNKTNSKRLHANEKKKKSLTGRRHWPSGNAVAQRVNQGGRVHVLPHGL